MRKENKSFYRRETILKEEESHRIWKEKFDPWLTEQYREVRFYSFFFINHKIIDYFIEDV
jgi:hypothetical protein